MLFSELFLPLRQYHSPRIRCGLHFHSRLSTLSTPSVLFSSIFFPLGVLLRFPFPRHALRVFSFFFFFSPVLAMFSFTASFEASAELSPLAQSSTDADPVSGSASLRSILQLGEFGVIEPVPNYHRLRIPALMRIQSVVPHLRVLSSSCANSE